MILENDVAARGCLTRAQTAVDELAPGRETAQLQRAQVHATLAVAEAIVDGFASLVRALSDARGRP